MEASRQYLIPILALCLSCLLMGCGNNSSLEPAAPFSPLTWASSPEDMRNSEGEEADSYVSVYNGVTYVYEKEYQGRNGTLEYMFDADEILMCIAWAYEAADARDRRNCA